MELQRKACEQPDFKLSEEGNGSFSGYGSVFGVLDRSGEIVVKGAFAETIPEFKQHGFIAVAHDWDALPVASVRDCYEDDRGLFIDAEFHSTPAAQAARTYVRERLQRKKSVGLSIGYWVRDSAPSREGLLLKQIDLAEISLVSVPANPQAGVGRAKTVTGAGNLPLASRDREWDASAATKRVRAWAGAEEAPNGKYGRAFMVRDGDANQFGSFKLPFGDVLDGELHAVPRAIFAIAGILQGARGGTSLSAEDRAGAKAKCERYYSKMRAAFDDDSITVPWSDEGKSLKSMYLGEAEQNMTWAALSSLNETLYFSLYGCLFTGEGSREERLARADDCLTEYHQLVLQAITALYPEEPATEALAAEVKALWHLSDRSEPPAGEEFSKQLETTLVLVSDCAHRGREIARLRAENGRRLSDARRAQLAALHDELAALLDATAPQATDAERMAAELTLYRRKARLRAAGIGADP
jgi:HK97 family phage prohead protease